jgi:hypothetical protein
VRDPPSPLPPPARNLHSITGDLSHFLPLHYFLLHSFLSLSQSMVGMFSSCNPIPSLCSCSCSLSSHLVPLILFLSPSRVVTLFPSLSYLSCGSCSSFLSSHLVPLILFLSPSHLTFPLILFLSPNHLTVPLILFLSPSHLTVPLILLFCFFACPLLVLLHVPLPFPLILFLLFCSSLLVVSLFSLSCNSVSFFVLS